MQRHAIGNTTHRMFAHAKVQIASSMICGAEITLSLEDGFCGRGEIRRAAHQGGQVWRKGIEYLSRGFA